MDKKFGHKRTFVNYPISKKIIPITKLRYFYKSLEGLRLSTKTQIKIVEDISRKENYKHLIALYEESKDHFADKYYNIDEPFLPKSPQKPLPINVVSIANTRDIISVFEEKQKEDGSIHVENNHNYDFIYLNREVSPLRTTNSEFETGKSGKSSGAGGVDFIGWNPTKKLPILGEIKIAGDKNPFYALIQLLTYLSELSTPNQIKRIIDTKLFGNQHSIKSDTSFYLYFLFTDLTPKKEEMLIQVTTLSKKLEQEVHEIEEIVFLNIHTKKKIINKIL